MENYRRHQSGSVARQRPCFPRGMSLSSSTARTCGQRDAKVAADEIPERTSWVWSSADPLRFGVSCLLEIAAVYKSQTCEMNWLISVGKATCATQLRPMAAKRRKINNKFPHRVDTPAKRKTVSSLKTSLWFFFCFPMHSLSSIGENRKWIWRKVFLSASLSIFLHQTTRRSEEKR